MTVNLATQRLPRQLQRLIDARLDTIDRMLLGRLPRANRLAVVSDVEGQVYELLGERPGHELDREDVLTVLARLDPPEAYIPEEGGYEAAAVLLPPRTVSRTPAATTGSPQATVIGILGLLLFGLVFLSVVTLFVAITSEGGEGALIVLLFGSFIMTVAGLPIFILSIVWRRGGAWAVVGMVAGAAGIFAGVLIPCVVYMF